MKSPLGPSLVVKWLRALPGWWMLVQSLVGDLRSHMPWVKLNLVPRTRESVCMVKKLPGYNGEDPDLLLPSIPNAYVLKN